LTVKVDRRHKVTLVAIDRPEIHNCVDTDTASLLEEAVRAFDADDGQRVLVLTGSGTKSFCSGADLKNPPRFRAAGPMGFSRLEVSKPTIAAINGYCFAGGLELACWCDFRIADETSELGVLNRRWGVPLIDGARQPDAAYLLVQRALQLDQAFQATQAEVAKLQGELDRSRGNAGGVSRRTRSRTSASPRRACPR
jgi:enoyl-CoA hydratase